MATRPAVRRYMYVGLVFAMMVLISSRYDTRSGHWPGKIRDMPERM